MMQEDTTTQGSTLIEVFQSQLNSMLAVLARPVVRWQIIAFVIILLTAWLLPEAVHRWYEKRSAERAAPQESSRWRRRLAALYQLVTPLLALLLLTIALWFFALQGYPNGLLRDLTNLVWIWLIYRALLTLVTARYGAAARPYLNRIVTPIFIFVMIVRILNTFPGSIAFTNAVITMGSLAVSLGTLVTAFFIFYIFVVIAWVVQQIMINTLPRRLNVEQGVIQSFAALTRYALISLGIIVALGTLGLDFTSLAIIAGGLSVGIGIGLQDIVSNFVSGLVLLFEQSLRPGDVVELNGRISRVEKISLRATTVRTPTNEELIIPNANFTTNFVKNYTKSDRLVQVIVPIGVSYDSDPEMVRHLAIETGLQHPLVLPEPAPRLIFIEYGDSSINFRLVISVNQPEKTIIIKSDIYYMLWKVFKEHNIEIPFPQRDLNLGSGWEKLDPKPQTQ